MLVPANVRGGAVALRPALQALKTRAEIALDKRTGDVVVFNKSLGGDGVGVTDVSFEHRKDAKQVSLYFTSKPEGIQAYRHVAAKLAGVEGVDFQYTPQFGQSRISFAWDEFWALAQNEQLGALGVGQLQLLEPPTKPTDVSS
ncbi:hypothetical protein ACHHYP_07804 [Achlya hypogyna]|uniref:Uncharacterized protein n=1 Tax=Achlya hypogyna TaxID=1202772 RepID=A0A1V9YQH3_ACHHY|nr:hypothetical protein ACHHYP_07804 [Achlya hypogyna]